jgi:hypothetical protein
MLYITPCSGKYFAYSFLSNLYTFSHQMLLLNKLQFFVSNQVQKNICTHSDRLKHIFSFETVSWTGKDRGKKNKNRFFFNFTSVQLKSLLCNTMKLSIIYHLYNITLHRQYGNKLVGILLCVTEDLF